MTLLRNVKSEYISFLSAKSKALFYKMLVFYIGKYSPLSIQVKVIAKSNFSQTKAHLQWAETGLLRLGG